MPPINPIITTSLEKLFSKKELQLLFLALPDPSTKDTFMELLEDKVRDLLCFSPHLRKHSDLLRKVRILTDYQMETLKQIREEGLEEIVFAETHPVVQ